MTMTEKKENSRKTKNSSRATLQKFPLGLKDFVTDSFEKAKKVNMENYKNRLEENYVPANNISLHTNFQEAISKRENFSPASFMVTLFLPDRSNPVCSKSMYTSVLKIKLSTILNGDCFTVKSPRQSR